MHLPGVLGTLMDNHFEILDKVREIKTVNRIPVTVSLGIVQSQDTFARQAEEAQVSSIWHSAAAAIRRWCASART